MAARIEDRFISAEYDRRVIATARYSEHTADGRHGGWTVSGWPNRLYTRNEAITAMVLAERLAAGYGDDDPFVIGWAASMMVLDASRRNQPVPRLAAWSLGAGIVATVGANLAHGVGHGPVGGSGGRARSPGAAAGTREDPRGPRRRGLHVPWL